MQSIMNGPSLNHARKFDERARWDCRLVRLHTEQSYWWRSKFLSECVWIATCIHAHTYASMLGDVIRACMACEILVQFSTDTHEFEKYSRGATKYTCVTRTRASSLNRAVPYIHYANMEGSG